MAGTLNKVMLIGNLGDEVKMHYFDDKNCVGRFPLATSETYTSKQTNERVTNTEWHNIVVRNKAAEICEKYLSKGDKVYIEGRIKTRKWTDDKGMDRYSTEIQCNEFTFLSTKNEQQQSQSVQQTNTPSAAAEPQQTAQNTVAPDGDDDLPF
ncbi:single-stranded DNA-binding protein [Winogradskyella sp. R77965]|uniref:single-stranded DNA-binding protein n=1 Tax=Winogradskyella sp. R77965 TaxID=3093872 RepID=UPI0037DCF09B